MTYFLSFFWLLGSLAGGKPTETRPVTQPVLHQASKPDVCQLFGSVYLTSDPKQKNLARYIVYIEPEEAYADLIVFKENNKLFADAPGLWFITTSRSFSDHIFFVTTNRAFADFSVHFTSKRTFAGCKD